MHRLISAAILAPALAMSFCNPAFAQDTAQYWLGEAPFCKATPADCSANNRSDIYVRSHPAGNGDTCLTGTKVLCKPPASARPTDGSAGQVNACPRNAKEVKSALTCECKSKDLRSGSVWGSEIYTSDSGVCRAALHAGVIPSTGGVVMISPEPGQGSYRGTTANGVTTANWGAYESSFRVSR